MGKPRDRQAKLNRAKKKRAEKNAWERPTWVPHGQLRYGVDGYYHPAFVAATLRSKGLSKDNAATREAFAAGLARTNLGFEEWHYKKCRELLANARKAEARQRELAKEIAQPVA